MSAKWIIAGASRSGKTTAAKQISQALGVGYLPFDSIISTIEGLYPETGMKHQDQNRAFSPKLGGFLREFFNHLQYEEMGMVIDVYQLFPVDYVKAFQGSDVGIVYLGYPLLSAEEKLAQVRLVERPQDWTKDTSDAEMINILNLFLSESQEMYRQCVLTKLPFFDTGQDFSAGVAAAVDYILHQ